jgi:simple sugar transport system ATP-binding protein
MWKIMNKNEPIVEMKNIVKRFPGVLANDHINFEVEKGEIHALLGENGAGKTTLMNILYGLYKPDEGEIYVKGKKVEIKSPLDSIKLGIGMVHQHFMLVPPLTVTENIILGLKSSRGPLLDIPQAEKRISELSEKYGLKVDPKAKIWQLPVGHQQRVEILKALYRGADILILDEPTSVLTPTEVKELFITLKRMAESGCTIIFITHKLNEVMAISNRVTVLRKGKVIGTLETSKTNELELAKMMVGRGVLFKLKEVSVPKGKTVLEAHDLYALNDKGLLALKGVSFKLHEGEILGIAGILT